MKTTPKSPPSQQLPSAKEHLSRTKLHEKATESKKEGGSLFKSSTKDIKSITQRGIFKQSLQTVSQNINKELESLQPGEQLEQEKQWVLNLNNIVNGKEKWDDNPAASNAFTYAYLAIMSGEIKVDGIDPQKLLKPEDGQKKINWGRALRLQGPVDTLTPSELAVKAQEELTTEFQIAQLALIPEEQFHLLEIGENLNQRINRRVIDRLLRQGVRHQELQNSLNIQGINKALLTGLTESEQAQLGGFELPTNQAEFRQLIHEITAGSIAEHISLNLPEGVESFDDLDLSETIKKAGSEKNIAEIPKNAYANKEKLKALPNDTDIYGYIRKDVIHKDMSNSDCSNIDILTDLATINQAFQSKLATNIRKIDGVDLKRNPTLKDIRDKINSLTKEQQTELSTSCRTIVLNTIKKGPWDQPIDLATTFLERKASEALNQEAVDLSAEKLTPEFFKGLEAHQIAPLLVAGTFTLEELQAKEGIRSTEIKQAQKELLYHNKKKDRLEMKKVVDPQDYQRDISYRQNADNYIDKATINIANGLNDGDRYVQRQLAIVSQEYLDQTALANAQALQAAGNNDELESIIKAEKQNLANELFTRENGVITPSTKDPQLFNSLIKEAKIKAVPLIENGDLLVKEKGKLAKQAEKKYKARHMTQVTAEKIDSSYLAALQKLGKIKPEVIQEVSENQQTEIGGFLNDSPVEHINLSPANYATYSSADWSIFFQLFPDIAQQVLSSLSEDKQQEIQNSFFS